MRSIPAICVSTFDPLHQARKFFDPIANNDEMPMVWHQAVRKNSDLEVSIFFEAFTNDGEERLVVGSVLEESCLSNGAIHHVKCRAA